MKVGIIGTDHLPLCRELFEKKIPDVEIVVIDNIPNSIGYDNCDIKELFKYELNRYTLPPLPQKSGKELRRERRKLKRK